MKRIYLAATFLAAVCTGLAFADHHEPAEERDIVATAASNEAFSTLVAAVKAADLVDTLQQQGPFTVLAPVNEAFEKIDQAELEQLLRPENRETLASILTFHVIAGSVTAVDALQAGTAETVQGEKVRFSLENGQLFVNGARILNNDIETSNGIIHVIDTVLMPERPAEPSGRKVIGVYTSRPSAALASQLQLNRNECLLIERLTENGNAVREGVERYDIVLMIDGHPATEDSLASAKEKAGFGGTIELVVLRQGSKHTIPVTVGIERH